MSDPIVINLPQTKSDWDTLNQDQLLMFHLDYQKHIKRLEEIELELRKYIVDKAFPDKHEGMNTLDLGGGYQLKAGVKFNYTLGDNELVEKTLEKIAKRGNEGAAIADRLVSWKPSFLLSEYRKLQDDMTSSDPMISNNAKEYLAIINEMLTVNDAAPTLKIKEPKVKS